MKIIDADDAEERLSSLIDQALQGEDVVIATNGKPVVRLVKYLAATGPRTGGHWKGRVHIAENFDAPLPGDIADSFGT